MKFKKVLNEVKISKIIKLAKYKDKKLSDPEQVRNITDNSSEELPLDTIEIEFKKNNLKLSDFPMLKQIARQQDQTIKDVIKRNMALAAAGRNPAKNPLRARHLQAVAIEDEI